VKPDDVIKLLKGTNVDEAMKAVNEVDDKKEMAEKLTEFAGTLDYLKGKHLLAVSLLKRSLLLDYENPYTHYNIAVIYTNPDLLDEDMSWLEKGEMAYKNALKYKPDFHQARYNLALLYYFMGRMDEARQEYKRITAAIGDDPLYRDLGMMLRMEDDIP
jgi:tetratricopeptide (TPR) repeat protein